MTNEGRLQGSAGRLCPRQLWGLRSAAALGRASKVVGDARDWIHGDDAAKKRLEQHGVTTIKEVAGGAAFAEGEARLLSEALTAAKQCRMVNLSIVEAVEYAIKHLRPPGGNKTLQEVCDFVLQSKEEAGRSDRHLSGMKSIYKRVCEDLGGMPISNLTQAQIENWLSEQDDVSRNYRISFARHLHIAFNEAIRRNWCAINPTANLERATDPSGDVEIWKPSVFLPFLAAAVQHEPHIVSGLVVKAFAGLRTSEMMKLDWSRISSSKIQILGKTAKTRRSRGVDIAPNLAAWLADYRKKEGPVVECSQTLWFEAIHRVCEHSGVTQPPNVLRHSYGTYKYHKTQSETETAYQMGNTPDVVIGWYRAVAIEDEDVENWWKITPEVVKAYLEGRFDLEKFRAYKNPQTRGKVETSHERSTSPYASTR